MHCQYILEWMVLLIYMPKMGCDNNTFIGQTIVAQPILGPSMAKKAYKLMGGINMWDEGGSEQLNRDLVMDASIMC